MPIWTPVHDWILETDGSIYLPFVPIGWDLQIEGIGFLEFSSSTWSGTIDIGQPQLDILIAQAALYLCSQKTLPQFTTDQNSQWSNASQMWGQELDSRISKYKMIAPPTTVRW
jgi:hypothetical protein